jgi:hypothetical protein
MQARSPAQLCLEPMGFPADAWLHESGPNSKPFAVRLKRPPASETGQHPCAGAGRNRPFALAKPATRLGWPRPYRRPGFGSMDQFAGPPGPAVPLRVVMNGNRLDIHASVDLEGLKKLQAMLAKYQGILEMMGNEPAN